MPLYDFICPCGEVTEALRGIGTASIPCPACGTTAVRAAVYGLAVKIHDGPGDWNVKTADGKWRLTHFLESQAENSYAYDRRDQIEGMKGPRPNLFKEAARRARQINPNVRV